MSTTDTKQKLLDAACDIFSEKGYRNATIKDICDRADANIAAVNYYFGSKKSLFESVWQHVFTIINREYPLDAGLGPNPSAAQRLQCHIRAVVMRTTDPGRVGRLYDIISSAVGANDLDTMEILKDVFKPHREQMISNVREILGPKVPEINVHMCCISIVNQCFCMFRGPFRAKKPLGELADLNPEMLAEHIFRFSLAGLESTRKMFENI